MGNVTRLSLRHHRHISRAYEAAKAAEVGLRTSNDPTSGFQLLIRACVILGCAHDVGAMKECLSELADVLETQPPGDAA